MKAGLKTLWICGEAGSSHDGELSKASQLVRVAKDAGCDAVKYQFWSSSDKVAERLHAPENAETLEKFRVPVAWLPQLSKEAHDLGLEFMTTVDLVDDIATVAPFVDRFKLASWAVTDDEFRSAHRGYNKPLVMSTGTATEEHLVRLISSAQSQDSVLQCTSAYPTPLNEAGLGVITWMCRAWPESWRPAFGLSDHTKCCLTGALAIAAGARALEVHFCLPDTSLDNPDRCVSLLPWQLREYVANAQLARKAVGDGVKRVMDCETPWVRHRYV